MLAPPASSVGPHDLLPGSSSRAPACRAVSWQTGRRGLGGQWLISAVGGPGSPLGTRHPFFLLRPRTVGVRVARHEGGRRRRVLAMLGGEQNRVVVGQAVEPLAAGVEDEVFSYLN